MHLTPSSHKGGQQSRDLKLIPAWGNFERLSVAARRYCPYISVQQEERQRCKDCPVVHLIVKAVRNILEGPVS